MIGYYVHHQGAGHLMRATRISRELAARGHRVVGFSSLARPDGWPGAWVDLPLDVPEEPRDETAGGVLHWAPLGHDGLRGRMGLIAGGLAGLGLMVVDVSVEVTLLSRLFGVPTVTVAMRGDRRDRPHVAAYDASTLLLAPWGAGFPESWWPERWTAKTAFVGAVSRFDGSPTSDDVAPGRRVLALWGGGGSDVTETDVERAREATPGWEWVWRSAASPSTDLWAELCGADVVVCHAGNNSVAEVAAARRPAVVVAQRRPFREQHHTVEALRRGRLAVAVDAWPAAERWPELLREARVRDGEGWRRWNPGNGAARAADALEQVLRGER